jgi:CelD/BcsL family acetyltransferase involved in cellulose biosynthesis
VTSPRIRTITSAEDLLQLRPLWEAMCAADPSTIFQDFRLNLLAARMFSGREQPFVVCAEASYGAAIIPAVVRHADASLRLLGDELFDYRCFLHQGDPKVLRAALAALAGRGLPLEIVSVRESEIAALPKQLPRERFCYAPVVLRQETSAERFAAAHLRLARNLRRLAMLRFKFFRHSGDYSGLLRFIYEKKAEQNASSLFRDPLRVEFMVEAAKMLPGGFEIFTLEDEASIAAIIVTLREAGWRRFYTGWFAPELEKHSPAISLIYRVTRQSLEEGLDCDYMTGEQLYKVRLATNAVQLYRVRARADELATAGGAEFTEAA